MPHAVVIGAHECPALGPAPLAREGGTIHKVVEVANGPTGWLLKSVIIARGETTRFLARIDRREDGLVVRLDDHVAVDRSPLVFAHLGLIARRVLDANPGSTLGATNLAEYVQLATP